MTMLLCQSVLTELDSVRINRTRPWPTVLRVPTLRGLHASVPHRAHPHEDAMHRGLPSSLLIPSALPVFFSTKRAATGGPPVAATEKSTASTHHHPIPQSIGRTLSSSTSPTSPCNHIGLGRAHRAFGPAAVTIVAAKLSSHVAVLLWAPTASTLRCSVSASMC
jgi:hypothetical protein